MTQKAIGPSFSDELAAYAAANNVAIIGAHFAWNNDGTLEFFDDTPATVVTAVEAVYASHNPATVPLAQQAQSAFSAGIQIASTGTPALNGNYAIDSLGQADIVAIETSINAGKGFPGGATTFNYPDANGVMHSFSEANFTDFAAAVRDYVYALKSVLAGASTALPSGLTKIA